MGTMNNTPQDNRITTAWENCNPASSAPIYPEALDTDTLNVIRLALEARVDQIIEWHGRDSYATGLWTDQLWAIDHASRALGIAS
jgi:hypothetical protein